MARGWLTIERALILMGALALLVGGLSTTWSAPPPHAKNDKPRNEDGSPRKGKGRQEEPEPEPEPSNTPPTISGSPDTGVLEQQNYYFQPSADDLDGDPLIFVASNLPRWAGFDTITGELSGMPESGDIGLYRDIVIAVSDGQATTEMAPFSIEVLAYANGSATLSWTAPTKNTDGSPLLDLSGYEVFWGPRSGEYPYSVEIPNAGVTTYVVENLPAGTHYFAVKALTDRGLASELSNEAMKTISF